MSSRLHSCQDRWRHRPKDHQDRYCRMIHHAIHPHLIFVAVYISVGFQYSQLVFSPTESVLSYDASRNNRYITEG